MNLHAVAVPTVPVGPAVLAMAVASGGTVLTWPVEWGNQFDGELTVETFDLADVELRDVIATREGRWVVVGDGGFAAISDNSGQTWATLDLGTSANLHAAFAVEDCIVVVGDEVVRVLEADNTWLEPAAPQGGWGQLRAGGWTGQYGDDPSSFVVGLGGAISSTADPSGVWMAEDSGVSVDLLAVGPLHLTAAAVGASGTFLMREAGEWTPIETERTVDFVDYQEVDPSYGVLLAADGEILQFELHHLSEGLRHLDRIEAPGISSRRCSTLDWSWSVMPAWSSASTLGSVAISSSWAQSSRKDQARCREGLRCGLLRLNQALRARFRRSSLGLLGFGLIATGVLQWVVRGVFGRPRSGVLRGCLGETSCPMKHGALAEPIGARSGLRSDNGLAPNCAIAVLCDCGAV
ncbi:MAG: hypothetical protein HC888_07365 [Candidatus Competibacteraceae bacterium]|nr:hypothetical protein [Candidatus Competibacteraceae bacterium]